MTGPTIFHINLMGIEGFLIAYAYNNDKCPPAEPPDIINSNLFSSKPFSLKNDFIRFIAAVISSSILNILYSV